MRKNSFHRQWGQLDSLTFFLQYSSRLLGDKFQKFSRPGVETKRMDEKIRMKDMDEPMRARLARLLMEKSYREGDFVLASGRRSDYYFDCRVTALDAEGSWLIGNLLNDLLRDLDIVGVGGLTLGADPLTTAVTVISHERGRPLHGFLIRKESKDHGTGRYVEGMGNFAPGSRVAVLEDVVTTGGSLLKAVGRAEAEGLKVVAVCGVLDRCEGGTGAVRAAGYELRALFTREELVRIGRGGA
jgi:orotate phosphoribosyltransferase